MNFKITFTLSKFPEVIRWTRSGSDEYSQWSNSQDIHKIKISRLNIGTSQWHHRMYLLFRAQCPRHHGPLLVLSFKTLLGLWHGFKWSLRFTSGGFPTKFQNAVCEDVVVSVTVFVEGMMSVPTGRGPAMITLCLLDSEMFVSLFCSASSSRSESLCSVSHSDSSRAFCSDSASVLSHCSFSLSFWAWASLECLHFIRRFWNHTLTWR